MDHYFSQDIEALRRAAPGIEINTMSFGELRDEALRVMPPAVADGLEAFAAPDNEAGRRRYAGRLRQILEDRFTRAPFDALVVPSDTFFYVRAAPQVAHDLGVPFVVVQKETTISEHTMRHHSEEVRRFAAPLADLMTVCSERHREFWLRAGGDGDRIVVTGQPRFDFYFEPEAWPAPDAADGPTVLFLSYQADAYHPDEGRGGSAWEPLHRQTEEGLHELARRGWRVLIKPHPQQSAQGMRDWRRRAGELWGRRVTLVHGDADVRRLIVTADVIVGFQSTALLEAMLAGRPAVYTGWDRDAAAIASELIPFADWEPEIAVVRDPAELAAAVAGLRGTVCQPDALTRRRAIAEHYLGPLDGGASRRTLDLVTAEAEGWAARRGEAQLVLRRRLQARRPPLRLYRRGRVGLRMVRRRLGSLLHR